MLLREVEQLQNRLSLKWTWGVDLNKQNLRDTYQKQENIEPVDS